MAELSDIINMRCPVSFDWHGQRIELAYRPYSEGIENEIKGEEGWTGPSMKALIVAVVLDWNLTDKGKPAPIGPETLTPLPLELVLAMFYAVQNDLRNPQLPNVTSGATS